MSPKWWVLAAVSCGTFMATLDASIVNIALPTLMKVSSSSLHQVKWVVLIYLLVITCLLLPMGRISDQYGRKPIFQIGFFVFILGSSLCGLAPSLGGLVLFRAVQAIGGAMLMANGPALITSAFSARDRGAALGTLAMVVSLGLVTGPSLGGVLIAQFGWRSIFWINLPIGALGILLVQSFVKKERAPRVVQPFDWIGAVLQSLLVTLLIFLFDPPTLSLSGFEAFRVPSWVIGLLAIVFGAVLAKIESEVKSPLFDLALLRIQTFWSANLAGFLTFIAFSSVSVLMPFFLEEVLHFSPQKAGLFMTVIPLTIFIVAPLSGRLSDRLGSQGLSFSGALIGVLGLFIMAGVFGRGLGDQTTPAGIILGLCTMGLALGLFQSPNNNAIMGCVPLTKLGVASAILATVRNLGLVTGTGLATSVFSWRMSVTGDFVSAFHYTLSLSGIIGIGAILASVVRRSEPENHSFFGSS